MIELVQELLPSGESIGGDSHRRFEQSQVVSFHPRCTVSLAGHARPRGVVGLVLHHRREVHERRHHRIDRPLHSGDHRAEMGLALASADPHGKACHALEA